MKFNILLASVLLFLFSCSSEINRDTYSEYQKRGNDISMKAQATLLKNVGMAIQKGGPQNAVEFCNIKASGIVDSLNQEFDCVISRISDKNRNLKVKISSSTEKELWQTFNKDNLADTLILADNSLVFYKPIKIGMPACLKCHGSLDSDINAETREKLATLYPKDLATGYALNDFRGLWKIEFERK